MIKYLVFGIWVTKLFIGLATLCTAFWLTHKSNSLGFVAEWFMLCHNRQHIWPGTIWFSKVLCLNIEAKPSPTTNLPLPIICCQMQFFHRRINLFSLKPHFLSNYPIFTRPLSFAEPIFTRTMNNENQRYHWHDPIWSPRKKTKKRATSLNTNLHLICVPISPKAAEATGRWTTAHSWKNF